MDGTSPIVSVGFPVYNGSRYLRGALDSVLAQDHPSFEVVLSDNASTDETLAICEEYAKRDGRIRLLTNDVNQGAVWNFNHVARAARGRYFMWAAHDDLWRSDCLSLYANALDRDSTAVLVYGHAQPIDSRGNEVGEPYFDFVNDADTARDRFTRALEHWHLHTAIYGMMRLEALLRTRLILSRVSCDLILLLELALQGKTLELDEVCSHKRVPDVGATYRSRKEQAAYLDPKLKAARHLPFAALSVFRAGIESLGHAQVPLREAAPIVAAATRLYLRSFFVRDLKEEVVFRLQHRHPEILGTLRGLSRRRQS